MGRADEQGWCILRTSGPRTLVLARALAEAGHEVWTPSRPTRRTINKGRRNEKKLDVAVPLLPTVVFARERSRDALIALSMLTIKAEPGFSFLRIADRIPIISDASIAGLRAEEARLVALDLAMREAETRAEAEELRLAALRVEQAERRASRDAARKARLELNRSAPRHAPGTAVTVREMAALTGVVGIVESNDGSSAWVRFGTRAWKIDAWRIIPSRVQSGNTLGSRDAA